MSTKVLFVVLALALVAGATAAPTECSEIEKPNQCKKSDDKFGFDCYWNPVGVECEEVPTNCTDIYDRKHCNNAVREFGTEDNCIWDHDSNECYVPTECEDLTSKKKCDGYEKYPSIDVTGGECKYKKKMGGCYFDAYPTECSDISKKNECVTAEEKYGFQCMFMKGECQDPPTTCDEIQKKNLCTNAYAQLGFPCFYQNGTCSEAPTTCEGLGSKKKCNNAKDDFGIIGCAFMAGECKTVTCEDLNKAKCATAEEDSGLSCYFDKPSRSCMTL